LAHRKTIHMLEKNRQKKRAIGTLDVAFKKRFFELRDAGHAEEGEDSQDGHMGEGAESHKRHHSKKGKGEMAEILQHAMQLSQQP
jgi:hypothetical protein